MTLKQDNQAVSPVIGVILMVAITVVLAAVVFILVSDLDDGGESAPDMAFRDDTSAHTLTLVRGDKAVAWSSMGVSCSTGDAALNGGTGSLSADEVTAGDVLSCETLGSPVAATLTLVHEPTNTLLGSWAL